jgi:hypothetical protein
LIEIYRTFLATDAGNVSGIDNVEKEIECIKSFLSFFLFIVSGHRRRGIAKND